MKKIKYVIVLMISFLLFNHSVDALSITLRASSSSITKGQTAMVTATISSSDPIASIEGTLMCTGAGSGSTNMQFDYGGNDLYSKDFQISVKGNQAGAITCSTTGVRVFVLNKQSDTWQNLGNKTITIKVNEPVVLPPKTYSSNNNLKSLSAEGYSLTPEFNKDTLEYSLEVPNGTETIKLKAELEDGKASASGLGEIKVSEGTNKIEIKVTAENGNVKTYILNVTVKELDPVEVTIDGKKYTIIRKEGILDPPENYEKSSIKIGDDDILCYKNLVTKNTLIGLKDEKGNSKYYIYDVKSNKYTIYNGYKIGGVNLSILDMPKDTLPSDYHKVTFEYNNNKLEGYQYISSNVTYAADESVKGNDFYLVYALNELSGEKGLYVYDKKEGTVQRYNSDLILTYQNKANNYLLYLLISLCVLALTIITFTIVLMKKSKHKNRFA